MSGNEMRHMSPLNPAFKPRFDDAEIVKRLKKPTGPVDVVFDSDTYNEVDDQFALVYMLRNSDRMDVRALYAAPYYNDRSSSPQDGMEKSYQEMQKILSLCGRKELCDKLYHGSSRYLPSETEPVISDAANNLAELAMRYTGENPLYVIAIGAITDIASALLINPEIKDRIVVIWLGGHALDWPDNYEFNLRQDIAAARVLYGSGAAIVMLPGRGVVSAFSISRPELEYWLLGKNELCDYLAKAAIEYGEKHFDLPTWTKPIWDVTAVGWLLGNDFMYDRWETSPIPEYDNQWGVDQTRHLIKYVYFINRDKLFYDLFQKITGETLLSKAAVK